MRLLRQHAIQAAKKIRTSRPRKLWPKSYLDRLRRWPYVPEGKRTIAARDPVPLVTDHNSNRGLVILSLHANCGMTSRSHLMFEVVAGRSVCGRRLLNSRSLLDRSSKT